MLICCIKLDHVLYSINYGIFFLTGIGFDLELSSSDFFSSPSSFSSFPSFSFLKNEQLFGFSLSAT